MSIQKSLPPIFEMKQAFLARDSSYDGIFFPAVRTTGIFCRPSCPARRPLEQNLEFFGSVRDALFAGYRPCLRCKPLETDGTPPEWLSGLMHRVSEAGAERIRDSEIRGMGVDPVRVRRYFHKHYGMTFQAFCRSQRLGKALEEIRKGSDLLDVAFDHGYESSSGFREAFAGLFHQSPGKSRANEAVLMNWIETPFGPMIAGATTRALCMLEFTDRRMLEYQFRSIGRLFGTAAVPGNSEMLVMLRKQLAEYFAGERKNFDLPLDFRGSDFQVQVWKELLRIPYGETRSYEDIARALGNPSAVRAVGHANGQNRIAIVIPCHRVVNKDGKLGGYGGGLWRKQFLLDLESQQRPLRA